MEAIARELRPDDFKHVFRVCYREHGFNRAPERALSRLFRRCYDSGIVCSSGVFENDQPTMLIVATFIHDWFVDELESADAPDVQKLLLKYFRKRDNPLLSGSELGRANASRAGANLLTLYYNQTPALQNSRLRYIKHRSILLNDFRLRYSGNNISKICGEVWTPMMIEKTRLMGFQPVNSYGFAGEGEWPEQPPCLIEFNLKSGEDPWLCDFLAFRKPDYKLTRRQIEMLRFYVLDQTMAHDKIAQHLGLEIKGLDSLWEGLRERMAEQDRVRKLSGKPAGDLSWLWARKQMYSKDFRALIVQHVRDVPSCLQPYAWPSREDPQPRRRYSST